MFLPLGFGSLFNLSDFISVILLNADLCVCKYKNIVTLNK